MHIMDRIRLTKDFYILLMEAVLLVAFAIMLKISFMVFFSMGDFCSCFKIQDFLNGKIDEYLIKLDDFAERADKNLD